jgi:hypothetical protein
MTQQVHKLALPQDMAPSSFSEADKAFYCAKQFGYRAPAAPSL